MCIKKRYHFANKGPYCRACGFSSSHVWMWELDHKEGWAPKNWRFPTGVLEKTLKSPLGCKEIQPVHPKGDQPWISVLKLRYCGRLMRRADSLEKTLMLGKVAGRRRRGRQRMRWLDGFTDSMDMNLAKSGRWWGSGKPGVLQSMEWEESVTTWWLNNSCTIIL